MDIQDSKRVQYTVHGQVRCQQRGISQEVVAAVIEFGRCRRAGRGGYSYSMDNKRRYIARKVMGEPAYKRIVDKLGIYVVVSEDGWIITVAHPDGKRRPRTGNAEAASHNTALL